MNKLFTVLTFICFYSCSTPKHPDATSLCDCWTRLRYEKLDSTSYRMADSCDHLYKNILNKLKDNKEEMATFNAAYSTLQENGCRK